MTRGTLLLSPHSDDAAMSSFGIITRKMLPEPVSLLTIFSWTDFFARNQRMFPGLRSLLNLAPRPDELVRSIARNPLGFGKGPRSILNTVLGLGTPYRTSRIRVLEDMSFSRRLGMKFSYMNFSCASVRHQKLVSDPESPLDEPTLARRLLLSLSDVILRAGVEAIVAPWPYASSQHIDHRIVYEAGTRVAETTGVKLFYVDDQPYSRRPVKAASDSRDQLYSPVVVKLSTSEMYEKHRAMRIYWSQMTPEYLLSVCAAPPGSPDLVCSETLWEAA